MKELLFASAAMIAVSSFAPAHEVTEIDRAASELDRILAERVEIPAGEQEARIFVGKLDPLTAGAWHVHPAPVYVYVTEGELTVEVEGQEPQTIRAGEGNAEKLDVRMRVVNRTEAPVEVVVFQISPADKELLEKEKQD